MIKGWNGCNNGCNNFHERDQICLQLWKQRGPNMDAILVSKGTKYACNLKSESDYICLQFLSIGTKYACNVRAIVQESRNYDFWTSLAQTLLGDCKHI